MDTEARAQIQRQDESVDVEGLRTFLTSLSADVSVQETHPGPQASVDWFLPPIVNIVLNYAAAHPFLQALGAAFTPMVAQKAWEKVQEAAAGAILDRLGEELTKVYKSAKASGIKFVRGERVIPPPPARFSFELHNKDVDNQAHLTLVFPDDLNDAQLRDAIASMAKAKAAAEKCDKIRGRFERRIKRLIAAGNEKQARALLLAEGAAELRRTDLVYVYRPADAAWVDAYELATEHMKLRDIEFLKEVIKNPPEKLKGSEKELRRMLRGKEKKVRDARAR